MRNLLPRLIRTGGRDGQTTWRIDLPAFTLGAAMWQLVGQWARADGVADPAR